MTARRLARSGDALGIEPLIRKRGEEHGNGPGRVRRLVERPLAWLKVLRRFRCRYGRSGKIIRGRATLAMSVTNFRLWHNEIQLASQ